MSLCGIAYRAIKLSCGVVSGVGPGIHVLDGSLRASRGRGCFWYGFQPVSNFRVYGIQWTNGVLITVMIDDQLVCEKLTIFFYAECIVEFYEGLAFLCYSQVQKFMCKNVPKQTQHVHCVRCGNGVLCGGHVLA